MMQELELCGDGVRLTIVVDELENPRAVGPDAEWLACEASLVVPGFAQAAFTFAMSLGDLSRLAALCRDLLAAGSGRRTFDIDEESLSLEFALEAKGLVSVRCTLRQIATARTQIYVEYGADRSMLYRLLTNANSALAHIRGEA